MAEETKIQQVMMKEPKKVEAGKGLAEFSHRKREAQSEPRLSQYYDTGVIVAIWASDILSYCIYQFKKTSKEAPVHQTNGTMVD